MITIILPEWLLWIIAGVFTINAVLTCIQIYCRDMCQVFKRNRETLRMIEKHMKHLLCCHDMQPVYRREPFGGYVVYRCRKCGKLG